MALADSAPLVPNGTVGPINMCEGGRGDHDTSLEGHDERHWFWDEAASDQLPEGPPTKRRNMAQAGPFAAPPSPDADSGDRDYVYALLGTGQMVVDFFAADGRVEQFLAWIDCSGIDLVRHPCRRGLLSRISRLPLPGGDGALDFRRLMNLLQPAGRRGGKPSCPVPWKMPSCR